MIKFIEWQLRRATARYRRLPDFIIVGAQKAGTSSLFYYLKQHPDITPSLTKEVHYFDNGLRPGDNAYCQGLDWYKAHFPLARERARRQLTGEASPTYLFNPLAAGRIAAAIPAVKIIVLLREPVARAISQYQHEKQKGREELGIEEALAREEDRLGPSVASGDFNSFEFVRHSYKLRGRYAEQLERYFEVFSRGDVLVMSSEEFFRDTNTCLKRVYRFLCIPEPVGRIDLRVSNAAKARVEVPDRVRTALYEYFQPHNERLFELLGCRFEW